VEMPGGTIDIDIHTDGHVYMTGAVSSVARGEFSEDFWKQMRGLPHPWGGGTL